ncbi:MAG TPA: response regulator transcription factor [Burkholderiaceae bacterium]|nr:response regulator transcription factor [Burkholderiaceae bacterium]
MKILMLADPDRVCGGREVLERESCRVDTVADIASAVAQAGRSRYEVVAVDLDQVRLAPAEVVGLLRQVSDAPLLLTRSFIDDVDQIVALEAGADAVAAQPLSPRLLLAHFRRLRRLVGERQLPVQHAAEYGPLKIDPARRRVTWRDRAVELCGSEVTIVAVLAAARGRPVARDELLQALGRPETHSRALNTAISRIRHRLQRQGIEEIRIQAVSRSGYRLVLCLQRPEGELLRRRSEAQAPPVAALV